MGEGFGSASHLEKTSSVENTDSKPDKRLSKRYLFKDGIEAMGFKERRKAPRVDVDLPISIGGEGGEVAGHTINISTNGIYFEISRYIEPLTKLRMGLVIAGGGEDGEEASVLFDGIVVRVEPEKKSDDVNEYKVAVFFTNVPEDSMEIISRLVSRHI